ncbi:MAG: hypothetical protein ACI8Y4_004706 [Candidatus Poriferisodalaceae bacterium]|jgi:hypothetical protein
MTNCLHDHSAWTSRWGPDDRVGAGNLMTAASRLAALSTVEQGELIDLGHVIEDGAPRIPPNQTPYVMTLSTRSEGMVRCLVTTKGPSHGILPNHRHSHLQHRTSSRPAGGLAHQLGRCGTWLYR